MITTLKWWLRSSQDPSVVSNKVRGAVLFSSSAIILLAGQFFHLQLTANDMISLASEVGSIAGLIWALFGALLHFITWIGTLRNPVIVPAAEVI